MILSTAFEPETAIHDRRTDCAAASAKARDRPRLARTGSPLAQSLPLPSVPHRPPVRILLVSDLHYTLPQLDWVVAAAPSFDLVVLAGDQLDISSTVSLDAQTVVVLRYLALLQAAGRVAIASGNHDLTGPDAHGEQAALWLAEARAAGVPTDGDSLLLGDTLVTICPWWDGPLGLAALERQLVRRCRAPAAALAVGLPLAAARFADLVDRQAPLRRWRARTRSSPGTGPMSFSPATCTSRPSSRRARGPTESTRPGSSTPAGRSGPVPCHVAIDLGEGTASWRSLMGSESLHLAAAQAPERTVF